MEGNNLHHQGSTSSGEQQRPALPPLSNAWPAKAHRSGKHINSWPYGILVQGLCCVYSTRKSYWERLNCVYPVYRVMLCNSRSCPKKDGKSPVPNPMKGLSMLNVVHPLTHTTSKGEKGSWKSFVCDSLYCFHGNQGLALS